MVWYTVYRIAQPLPLLCTRYGRVSWRWKEVGAVREVVDDDDDDDGTDELYE